MIETKYICMVEVESENLILDEGDVVGMSHIDIMDFQAPCVIVTVEKNGESFKGAIPIEVFKFCFREEEY